MSATISAACQIFWKKAKWNLNATAGWSQLLPGKLLKEIESSYAMAEEYGNHGGKAQAAPNTSEISFF